MPPGRAFEIVYDPEVSRHLKTIERKYHGLIRRTIERQLRREPATETINKKSLLHPLILQTAWDLRFGPDNRFRVFYRADEERREVYILAIGVKVKERLWMERGEIRL